MTGMAWISIGELHEVDLQLGILGLTLFETAEVKQPILLAAASAVSYWHSW